MVSTIPTLLRPACVAPFDPTVTIRPGTAADGDREQRFWAMLSPQAFYSRFFNASREVARGLSMDPARRLVLLAERAGEIVGIGELSPDLENPRRAEVAFAVLETMQHHGIASRLLQDLVRHAQAYGIEQLTASVMATNQPMLAVFHESGLVRRQELAFGECDLTLSVGG